MRRRMLWGVCCLAGVSACARVDVESSPDASSRGADRGVLREGARPRAPDGIVSGPTVVVEGDPAGYDNFGGALTAAPDLVVATASLHAHADGGEYLGSAGSTYTFESDGGAWVQTQELTSSTPRAGANFGASLARDGDTIVVGAFEDWPASAPLDAGANGPGAVYVFTRTGTGPWSQQQRLDPADGVNDDLFGTAVAIVGDTLFVGAMNSGKVYGYTRSGSTWTLAPGSPFQVTGAGSRFGQAIAFDGHTLLVGAQYDATSGAIYVYSVAADGSVTRGQTITPPGSDQYGFGESIALFGDEFLAGASTPNADASFLPGFALDFTRPSGSGPTGTWSYATSLAPPDTSTLEQSYGSALALSATAALVGASNENGVTGAAYLFERANASTPFAFTARVVSPDADAGAQSGFSVALTPTSAWVGAPSVQPSSVGLECGEIVEYGLGDAATDAATLDAPIDAPIDAADADSATLDLGLPDGGADAPASDLGVADSGADAPASDLGVVDEGADVATADLGIPDSGADAGSADLGVADAPAHDDAGSAALATTGLGACSQDHDCSTGHCVDGVCCDTACDAPCMSCVLAIAPGRCSPEPYGYDLHHDCQSASCATTCNGAGACTTVTAGSQCAPVHCVDATHTQGAAFCSGVGAACPTSAGVVDDCAPYACFDSTGACLTTCVSSSQCAPGFICQFPAGECVSAVGSSSSGGCAVGAVGTRGRSSTAALALVAALVAARRRRR